MDINAPLGAVARVEGLRALFAYVAGMTIGTALALPILAVIFGIALPVV